MTILRPNQKMTLPCSFFLSDRMQIDYIPVVLLALIGTGFTVVILVLSHFTGPHKYDPVKEIAYESGMDPAGDARFRFNVKFYLLAMMFILFDIEVVFLFPWAVVFKDLLVLGNFILYEMAAFIGLLLFGYFYLLKKGAFEWD